MTRALFLVACIAALCPAQTPPAHNLALTEGRGDLLRFQQDIARVVIAEPKIADAIVVSPREIMVNAKTPGHTTLIVWETGAEPARWEIEVSKDNADWEQFHR